MGCACKDKNKTAAQRQTYTIQLAGGTKITKAGKAAAEAFVASHPGARIV